MKAPKSSLYSSTARWLAPYCFLGNKENEIQTEKSMTFVTLPAALMDSVDRGIAANVCGNSIPRILESQTARIPGQAPTLRQRSPNADGYRVCLFS